MGRNFKLKGRTLLTADIINPEIPYAEFSESILHMEAKNIINELNYGSKMLELYEQSRSNMHIVSVVEMLEKMEECFMAYDYRRTGIKKGGKNENRVCDTPREGWINAYIKRLKTSESIYEIRFKYKQIQYRPLGFFGPNTNDFTFLVPATEQGDKFKPKDAIKMAEERRINILKGLGDADVCTFESDITQKIRK